MSLIEQVEQVEKAEEATPIAEPPCAFVGLTGLRVLLVEDEDNVRQLTTRMLERLGCRVIAASDPLEALACYDQRDFDLLLVDVVLPHMIGTTLAEQIRFQAPGLPVLHMSGYEAVEAAADALGVAAPLLRKPFTQHELGLALEAVLRERTFFWGAKGHHDAD